MKAHEPSLLKLFSPFLVCLYATVPGSVHATHRHSGVFRPEEVRARGLEGSHAG